MLKKNAIKNAIGRSSKLKIVEFMRAKRFSRLTQFSSSIETDKVSILKVDNGRRVATTNKTIVNLPYSVGDVFRVIIGKDKKVMSWAKSVPDSNWNALRKRFIW